MKKIYTLLFILPLIALIIAFTSGPDAGYAGSPLDGQDCTACHPGTATSVNDWIEINVGQDGYVPGDTYMLNVVCTDVVSEKMGFQITSETASAKMGTWMITNTTRTQLKGSTAVTHTAAGTTPVGSPNTWSMEWTAPPEGTGEVSFYLAVNKSNADNTYEGDEIYVCTLTVQESNVGIAENLDARVGYMYPNPASNMITMDVPVNAQVNIYDNLGREAISMISEQESINLDISALQQGLYYVNIRIDGQIATRSFVKR